jgi:hypothetical protein
MGFGKKEGQAMPVLLYTSFYRFNSYQLFLRRGLDD